MATITTLPAFPLRDLYCFQSIGIRLPDSELTTVCVCGAANEACSAVARSVAIQILLEILVVLSAKTFCLDTVVQPISRAPRPKSPLVRYWLVLGGHPRDCFGA